MKIFKFMIYVIFILIILIILKSNQNYKNVFYNLIYKNNISFAKINRDYNKIFGKPIPFEKYIPEELVLNEKMKYNKKYNYKDGVMLEMEEQFIPALESGIVIFKGNKENCGKTIIIQQENGLDVWYSNLNNIEINMYEYVEKGKIIGNVEKKLYLIFTKNGEIIDPKKYI